MSTVAVNYSTELEPQTNKQQSWPDGIRFALVIAALTAAAALNKYSDAGMLTRSGKSEAEVEAEARDVA